MHLRDGAVLEETVETPRGGERHFASAGDVTAKFAKLAGRVLPSAQLDQLMTVLDLDKLPDAGALVQALAR